MPNPPTGFYFAINASVASRSISYSKRQMECLLLDRLQEIPTEVRPRLYYHEPLNFFYFCHDHDNRNDLLMIRKIIEEGVVSFRSRVSKVQTSRYHRAGYMINFHKGSRIEQFIRSWLTTTE